VRTTNQDHFLFATLHQMMRVGGTSLPDPELLEIPSERLASFGLVADGVGSHAGAEMASRAALEAIAGYVTHTMQCFFAADASDVEGFMRSLREAMQTTHDAVLARARDAGYREGMATTLTMIMAVWPHLYLAHVGDSRCYRLRAGRLELLTRDQTVAQDLVDAGVLPAERAPESPVAHVLSSALGGETTQPAVGHSDLEASDVILLCTDGLTKHVPSGFIEHCLGHLESSAQACRELVDAALAAGGTDNVTVVVLRAAVRDP